MGALFAKIGSWLTGLIGFQVFNATNRYVFLGILIAMFLALYVAFMASVAAVFSFSPIQPGGMLLRVLRCYQVTSVNVCQPLLRVMLWLMFS